MQDILEIEKSIASSDDFELSIKRTSDITYRYSYPKNRKLNGMVFVISGFGDDTNSDYNRKLRSYIAKEFDVCAISVDYHCFFSRPNNGAKIEFDEFDRELIINNLNSNGIEFDRDESTEVLLDRWDRAIQDQKDKNSIDPNVKSILTATLNPKRGEYQNFGVLQALDHINVIYDLEKERLDFKDGYPVILMGSSHGGYIAYMVAKLAPFKIDCVIDNSSYVKPPLNYIIGKEIDYMNPEFILSRKNIMLNCFVKTEWSLNKNNKSYFSDSRYMIRDVSDKEHLDCLADINNKIKFVSYHSIKDTIAPYEDKLSFYDTLKSHGFDCKLYTIEDEKDVDGRFIKSLSHGLDMSLKELAKRELPKALEIKSNKKDSKSRISYNCHNEIYEFRKSGDLYIGAIDKESLSSGLVEEKAVQTYQNNISYIQISHPKLYKKIVDFETALERGFYKERYELEYKDEGYFDVRELSSGKYLYGSDSNDYAKNIAKSIDYKKEDNIFIVFKRFDIDKDVLKELKKSKIDSNNIGGVIEVIDYANRVIPPNSTVKRWDKFVFFGIGLGVQIKEAHKKIKSDFYLLVEDDLELFRLSLFVTDYSELAKSAEIYFSVFDEDAEAKKVMQEFMEDGFMHNHYLKFIHSLHQDESKMRLLHEVIASLEYFVFPYHAYFNKYLRPLEYLKEGYNFLNLRSENSPLKSKRVLVLAAGPSLQKNLSWVKANRDKFITIALTSTLSTLEKEGIVPDIITHLDPFVDASLAHLNSIKDKRFFNESIYLIAGQTPLEVAKLFKKDRVFVYENGTEYKRRFETLAAPCVGSMSYLLSVVLGAKEIYLLGLDLALDQETGLTHSSSHAHVESLDTSNVDTKKIEEIFDFKTSLIKVKGNFRDEVLTTPNFYISIESIYKNSKTHKKEFQKVYNLSDGAYLEDTIPTKIEEITKLKKVDKTELFKEFKEASSDILNENELKPIENMLTHAQKVKSIIKKHKKIGYKNSEVYKHALMSLSLDITADRTYEARYLHLILLRYMQYIYPYIFDLLNTKEVKNIPKHIEYIDRVVTKKMTQITDIFIERLELFFEEEVV
jgi:hypothetical protein